MIWDTMSYFVYSANKYAKNTIQMQTMFFNLNNYIC